MDRESTSIVDANGGSRILIQIINSAALGLMLISTLNSKYPQSFKWIKIFIAILIIYGVIYTFNPISGNYTINHYIRLLMNLVGFMFFYNAILQMNENGLKKYMRIYVITLLTSSAVKIITSSLFSLENLGAGDTASIALVFLIPLFFIFFRQKYAVFLYAIAFAFTIISLRRTCIIAFTISAPFIYSYLKQSMKFSNTTLITTLLIFVGLFLWQYFDTYIITRFSEMTNGNGESYGSGRSIFYVVLIEDFFNNPNSYLFGNGLNSVWEFFQLKDFVYLPHAHNDFLEILYTFGLVGFFIWISFLVSLFKEKWNYSFLQSSKKLFLMSICLYLIVAMASGTILRIEMIPFVMSISFILASKNKAVYENILLFQRTEHSDVLVAKDSLLQRA
jgi:hypothetical protein